MAVNLGRILSLNTMGFDEDGNLSGAIVESFGGDAADHICEPTKKKETKWA